MELDQATIDDLKQKHGPDLIKVTGPDGPLVFRKTSKVEWEHFQDNIQNEKKSKSVTIRGLARQLCVFPDAAAFDAAIEAMPGIPTSVLGKVTELVGLGGDGPEKL